MHGNPQNMQNSPLRAREALTSVGDFFRDSEQRLLALGFSKGQYLFDPGIGFGKTDGANFQLLQMCMGLSKKYPMVVGVSRKSFIGRQLDIDSPELRDPASKMLEVGLMLAGVQVIRTHQVGPLARMRKLLYEE